MTNTEMNTVKPIRKRDSFKDKLIGLNAFLKEKAPTHNLKVTTDGTMFYVQYTTTIGGIIDVLDSCSADNRSPKQLRTWLRCIIEKPYKVGM